MTVWDAKHKTVSDIETQLLSPFSKNSCFIHVWNT